MNIAVIFAGGVGKRMNSKGIPKQFLEVNGVPIIIHTLKIFQKCRDIEGIVIACVKEYIDYMYLLAEEYNIKKICSIVEGGETGQESIYNGLKTAKDIALEGKHIVLIHDGVRPLIDENLLYRNIESVMRYGSGISSVSAKETIVLSENNEFVEQTTKREQTYLVRAPQSFWLDDILYHYERAKQEKLEFIDSCTLMSYYGKNLHMVNTSYQNIKITTPEDYYLFKALLMAKENAQIMGVE